MVIGKVRAKQFYQADVERGKHMAVLLHGDGAFSGQVGLDQLNLDACS